MSKIFLSLLLSFVPLFSVDWLSYADAKRMQKNNNKIIMIDAVRSECHYCSDMELEVFEDTEMIKYLNERFILVQVNLDDDSMPLDIKPVFTPSFYFINKNKKLIKTINGSWNIRDFKSITRNIK